MTMPELADTLAAIGLKAAAAHLEDLLARATRSRLSPTALLEEVARIESSERARRGLELRMRAARLGSFKPMADFDWSWPKKIDRDLIEQALQLAFITERRNLALVATNGLGKTMIAKNIAHTAVLGGHTVLFRTASELLTDLGCDSPQRRRSRLTYYTRPDLLCIDEVGYLSYDDRAADLLFEVVTRRHEHRSILVTTNLAFSDWSTVFPDASCLMTLLDRLLHHADVALIEGESYRAFEGKKEREARRRRR
jgi:DNA replication protein DnaC